MVFFRSRNKRTAVSTQDNTLNEHETLNWNFANQSYKGVDERSNIGEWEYDGDSSNIDTGIWHNHKTRQSHVSNRGSTSAYDWGVSDSQIALGLEDHGDRFKNAVNAANKAHYKHGYKVSTSGHSLGGNISNYQTERLGDNDWYESGVGFNSGVSSVGKDGYFGKRRVVCRKSNSSRPSHCDKALNVKEQGDLVSEQNAVCSILTFGMAKRFCGKKNGFGKEKIMSNYQQRKLTYREMMMGSFGFAKHHLETRANQHSLSVFKPSYEVV